MRDTTHDSRPGRRGRVLRRTALAAALLAAVAGVHATTSAPTAIEPPAVAAAMPTLPASFADLIERVGPAVVNIATEREVGGGGIPFAMPENGPGREFFERFFGERTPRQGAPRKAQAQGSGFVVDTDGLVVTNNHVIDGAEKITVTLHDGTRLEATRVGVDAKTDLALLKVDAGKALPFVRFGDASGTRVGDWVVAIGNPFGLGGSATAGIVSARGRDINSGPYDDFIQVDAPINRGNSGGPLFDTQGHVIGVNSAIYSPNGGSVGIGFAIPADLAGQVVAQLRDHGSVARGWLGVQVQAVDAAIAESLALDRARGALVADVVSGSPAAAAGLRPGDVIIGFAGKPVDTVRDLPRLVADVAAGHDAAVEVWRDGKAHTLSAEISRAPEAAALASGAADEAPAAAKLGLALAELTPENRREFGLPTDAEGVLVTAVEPGSPAAQRGLRRGDVLQMVGRVKVGSVAEVVDEVGRNRDDGRDSVLLLVRRDDTPRFVTVDFA